MAYLDIIKRASQHFDQLYVGIFKNDQKNPLFPTDKRVEMLEEALTNLSVNHKVKVIKHERDLTVNIAKTWRDGSWFVLYVIAKI